MSDTFWSTVFVVGIVQGLFLAVILMLQEHTNRSAARLLAAMVLLVAIGILLGAMEAEIPARWALLLVCLNINTELAFGPLIYLLVRSVAFPERGLGARELLHFLPMLAGVVAWTLTWSQTTDPQSVLDSEFSDVYPVLPYLGFKALVFYVYLGLALVLLQRAQRRGRRYARGRRPVDLRRLRTWLLAFTLVPATIYASALGDALIAKWNVGSDDIGGLLLTVTVFMLLGLLLLRPWLLSVDAHKEPVAGGSADGRRLLAQLEQSALWRDSELDLSTLAKHMDWSDTHLSQVINRDLGSNFYALLGSFRLAEFERLARQTSSRDCGVLDLAMDAGFNSKASFYRAFRQRHGATTPAAFRASVASS